MRFSRGMSTPTMRAILLISISSRRSDAQASRWSLCGPRPPSRGFMLCLNEVLSWVLALTLLVAQVLANDHHAAITSNHLALIADGLNAGLNLHGSFLRRRRL